MSFSLRKFAKENSIPTNPAPLVQYASSEDSADETTPTPTIENGHSPEDSRTSVDKYFLGPEVNDNTIPGLNISTGEMEPCTDQIQCESSNVTDQVFSSNEIFESPENNSVNIMIDGLVPNQTSVSYGGDLPADDSMPTAVHQIIPPAPTSQPREPSSTMMILDDDDPPPNIEQSNPNGQVPEVLKYPDDANYYMPSDKDAEVAKAWGQFPQWARYDTKSKAFTLPKRALLEGRDLNSGIEKLLIPPPGKPNVAYLANEQVDFNCFYEFVERTRTNPDQIGRCAFISSTTWVSIAPESKAAPNRKINYNPAYQDKNSPATRLCEPVIKAFYGCTGRAKYMKYFREKIDYFEIDQIFIPIIEEEHWSLAIVNHPRKAFKKLLEGITRQQVAEVEEKYSTYSKNKDRMTKRRDEYMKEVKDNRNDLEMINIDVDAELEKFKKRLEEEQIQEEKIKEQIIKEEIAMEEENLRELEEQQAREEAMEDDERTTEDDDQSDQEGDESSESSDDGQDMTDVTKENVKEENCEKEGETNTDGPPEVPRTSPDTMENDDDKEQIETKPDTEQVIEKLEQQTLVENEEPAIDTTSTDEKETSSPQTKEKPDSEQPDSEIKEEENNAETNEKDEDKGSSEKESCSTDSDIPDDEPNNLEPSEATEDQNKEIEQESEESPAKSIQTNFHVLERINKIYHLTNDIKRMDEQINSMEENKVEAPDEPTEDDPVIYILCSLRNGEEKGRMKCDAINQVLSHLLVYEHDNDKRITAFDKYREELKNENPDIYDLWMDQETQHWKDLLPFVYRFPLVPHQVNDYDCGLFVSKFIQMYLDKENRPPMTANKTELETIFPPREIFDLKFKYRNILRELRGEAKEETNVDGDPEANGYLATLEESLNWGRDKKDQDRMRIQYESMMLMRSAEDSDDYSSDEDDSELDEDLDEEDEDHMGEDLYGEYNIGDVGRRHEYQDNHEESMQPNFQSFEPQNDTNEFEYNNDNDEQSDDDTEDALKNALADLGKIPQNVREIKKSDHSLNEHIPDSVSESKSDLPQQENASPVLDDSSKSEQNSEVNAAQPENEYLPDKTIENLQTPSIDDTHPNAEKSEKKSEPEPKLPKPSSPAAQKSAVRNKTTLDTPVKDQTEIPKTRQKTSDESKEILEKKLKGKADREFAMLIHTEINGRPQRKTRQAKEVTPSRIAKKSQKVRRKTIAVATLEPISPKPARRKPGPVTPKTEPRNQSKRKKRLISTSSTSSSKQPSEPKNLKSTESTKYSDELSSCMKIQLYQTKKNRRFDLKDHSNLKTLSEIESMPKTISSENPGQNGLDSTSSGN